MVPGPSLNMKTVFPRYGDSHGKDKMVESIFNMSIPILVRHLYTEMVPGSLLLLNFD